LSDDRMLMISNQSYCRMKMAKSFSFKDLISQLWPLHFSIRSLPFKPVNDIWLLGLLNLRTSKNGDRI